MSAKYFSDADGNYLGAFAGGAKPPAGAIERSGPPSSASDTWDGEKWVPDLNAELTQRRNISFLSRQDFCLSLLDRNILSPADAARAALGEWPDALSDMVETMSETDAAKSRIIWASSSEIHRTHWLLLQVASSENLNIAEETLDDIFGCNIPTN